MTHLTLRAAIERCIAGMLFSNSEMRKFISSLMADNERLAGALTAIVASTDYGADDNRPLMQEARTALAAHTSLMEGKRG